MLLDVLPLNRPHDDDNHDDVIAIIERWRSKCVEAELPTIAELASFVDRPLSDDEKIPISADRLRALVSQIDIRDVCTFDDVRLLFRTGHGSTLLDTLFFTVAQPPPSSGAENSFISFWDRNVRDVLELLVPAGYSTRNSNLHMATRALRPDYAFLLDNLCLFRGEEKAPANTDDPKQELANKLAWAYSPAPYVLGDVVIVEFFEQCISDCCSGRLLCHGALSHAGGNQPTTARPASPNCA